MLYNSSSQHASFLLHVGQHKKLNHLFRMLIRKALMMERGCQTANMCWLGSHFQISIYEYLHFFWPSALSLSKSHHTPPPYGYKRIGRNNLNGNLYHRTRKPNERAKTVKLALLNYCIYFLPMFRKQKLNHKNLTDFLWQMQRQVCDNVIRKHSHVQSCRIHFPCK